MPKKRSGLFVRQEVYDKVRDHCRENDLVMARWVEQVCLNALTPTKVAVPYRPLPELIEEPEDQCPVWSRPPFWHRP